MTATLSLPFFLPLPLPAPLPMVSYRGVGLSGAASTACGSSLLGAGLPLARCGLPSLASCPPTRTLYGSGAPAAGMGAPAAREALN